MRYWVFGPHSFQIFICKQFWKQSMIFLSLHKYALLTVGLLPKNPVKYIEFCACSQTKKILLQAFVCCFLLTNFLFFGDGPCSLMLVGLASPSLLHQAIVWLLCAPRLHLTVMTHVLPTPVTLRTHFKRPTTEISVRSVSGPLCFPLFPYLQQYNSPMCTIRFGSASQRSQCGIHNIKKLLDLIKLMSFKKRGVSYKALISYDCSYVHDFYSSVRMQ